MHLHRWGFLSGYVYIDNNLVENAIRPFVLGRKNWLFSGSPDGAFASAFWYSLLQTAKANGKDPYKVLLHFLKGLPLCQTSQDCEKLFFDSMGWS
jgi:transposase